MNPFSKCFFRARELRNKQLENGFIENLQPVLGEDRLDDASKSLQLLKSAFAQTLAISCVDIERFMGGGRDAGALHVRQKRAAIFEFNELGDAKCGEGCGQRDSRGPSHPAL